MDVGLERCFVEIPSVVGGVGLRICVVAASLVLIEDPNALAGLAPV